MVNHKYRIALCNVFWSEGDVDTRFFETTEEQNTYFDNLTVGKISSLSNFNMGNNITTEITYRDDTNRTIEELVGCNYAVVQKFDEETGVILNRRYFFAYPQQDSGRQMRVTLSLDDIQTNYFKYKDKIAPCLIKRACLNRWIDNGDGSVSFNGKADSQLFEREELQNVAKRLISREKVSLYKKMVNISEEADNWLNENVVGWIYAYLDQTHAFNVINEDSTTQSINFLETYIRAKDNDSNISTNLTAICVPILRTNKILNFVANISFPKKTINITTNQRTLQNFLKQNNGAAYVFSMKISANPPFYNLNKTTTYSVSSDDKSLTIESDFSVNSSTTQTLGKDYSSGDLHIKIFDDSGDTKYGLLYVNNQPSEIETIFDTKIQYEFNKNEIVGSTKNYKFNPKLLSSDYMTICVGNENGNFEYDAQKINKQTIDLLYSEPLTPDISKTYIRFKGDENSLYDYGTGENFTGYVSSNDMSLTLVTTAYQQMLANNKNYFLQNTLNRVENFAGGLIGAGLNVATGNYGAAAMGVGESVATLFSNVINQKLTIDNLKGAPSSIQNAKGNIFLNLMSSDIGLIVEIYDILENEKIIINDFLTEYGFSVNLTGSLSDFDNIRYYFNYIETDVGAITAPISNTEKDRLRRRLQAVRFWNSDTIQYDKENYERSLL